MRRRALLTLAFALTVIGATSLAPQARAQGAPSACFYEHSNFRGRMMCIRVGQRLNSVGGYNDMFSSVQIQPGVRVTMCQDDNFRGRCMTLDRSMPDFTRIGFNDMVSSVAAAPVGRPGGDWHDRRDDRDWRDHRDDRDWRDRPYESRGPGSDDQVCFYVGANFRGPAFCVPTGASVNWVGDRFNDKFSSITMPPGASVFVCQDADFRGRCREFRGAVSWVGDDWNDMISSFKSRR